MKKELEEKLINRWPKWFDVEGRLTRTLMPLGFCCGDGWFDIIWNLCELIETIGVPDNFEVFQVKEKFGGLRFYTTGNVGMQVDREIMKAENKSLETCEYCGKPGTQTKTGWIKTLCSECNKEK